MFGLGKQYFAGIDFGTSSIKVIVLSLRDGRPILVNYGEASLDALSGEKVGSQGDYDALVTTYLRALLKKMGTVGHEAYIAMPAFIGLVTMVEFPRMKEAELDQAIRFEAHKHIPTPLEEVALSWEIIGEGKGGSAPAGDENERVEILMVAALKKEVERYESFARLVGLETKLLELETFSLVRSLTNGDPGVYLIIDIGSRATNLVLVEEARVKVSRNLDVGGQDITRTIADNLSISIDRANTLKKSGKDFLNGPEGKLLFPSIESIVAEARRMMQDFSKNHPKTRFDGIILSGGTAGFAGLTKYCSAALGIPVSIGDPWRHVTYHPKLERAIREMSTSYSVALGLALYGAGVAMQKK